MRRVGDTSTARGSAVSSRTRSALAGSSQARRASKRGTNNAAVEPSRKTRGVLLRGARAPGTPSKRVHFVDGAGSGNDADSEDADFVPSSLLGRGNRRTEGITRQTARATAAPTTSRTCAQRIPTPYRVPSDRIHSSSSESDSSEENDDHSNSTSDGAPQARRILNLFSSDEGEADLPSTPPTAVDDNVSVDDLGSFHSSNSAEDIFDEGFVRTPSPPPRVRRISYQSSPERSPERVQHRVTRTPSPYPAHFLRQSEDIFEGGLATFRLARNTVGLGPFLSDSSPEPPLRHVPHRQLFTRHSPAVQSSPDSDRPAPGNGPSPPVLISAARIAPVSAPPRRRVVNTSISDQGLAALNNSTYRRNRQPLLGELTDEDDHAVGVVRRSVVLLSDGDDSPGEAAGPSSSEVRLLRSAHHAAGSRAAPGATAGEHALRDVASASTSVWAPREHANGPYDLTDISPRSREVVQMLISEDQHQPNIPQVARRGGGAPSRPRREVVTRAQYRNERNRLLAARGAIWGAVGHAQHAMHLVDVAGHLLQPAIRTESSSDDEIFELTARPLLGLTAIEQAQQILEDHDFAVRLAAEMNEEPPPVLADNGAHPAVGSNNMLRGRTQALSRQRPLAEGQHCVICFEDQPKEPVGCIHCRQLLGCYTCVFKWRRTTNASELNRRSPLSMGCSSVNHRKCPLCRAEWNGDPEVGMWDDLRTD